jgi:hypothetical protein
MVYVARGSHHGMRGKREGADDQIINVLANKDFNNIKEEQRGLARSLSSHGAPGAPRIRRCPAACAA